MDTNPLRFYRPISVVFGLSIFIFFIQVFREKSIGYDFSNKTNFILPNS